MTDGISFQVDGPPISADEGSNSDTSDMLVVFDTSVTFHPSTPVIVRCFKDALSSQATVFLDGN